MVRSLMFGLAPAQADLQGDCRLTPGVAGSAYASRVARRTDQDSNGAGVRSQHPSGKNDIHGKHDAQALRSGYPSCLRSGRADE
jgi:hypothetical protein